MKFLVPVVAAFGLALAAPASAQDAPASPPSNPAAPADATPPAPPTDTQPAPATAPAPAPAPAMDAAPPAPPAAPAPSDAGMAASTGASGGPLPTCSATVHDRCQQPAAAERLAAQEYKGGGHDNSAMMRGHGRPMHKRHKA